MARGRGLVSGETGYTAEEMRDPHGEYRRRWDPPKRHRMPGDPEWHPMGGVPGGAFVDLGPSDLGSPPAVVYGVGDPPPEHASALEKTDYARALDAATTYTCRMCSCEECGAQIVFLGKAKHMPRRRLCPSCREAEQ